MAILTALPCPTRTLPDPRTATVRGGHPIYKCMQEKGTPLQTDPVHPSTPLSLTLGAPLPFTLSQTPPVRTRLAVPAHMVRGGFIPLVPRGQNRGTRVGRVGLGGGGAMGRGGGTSAFRRRGFRSAGGDRKSIGNRLPPSGTLHGAPERGRGEGGGVMTLVFETTVVESRFNFTGDK